MTYSWINLQLPIRPHVPAGQLGLPVAAGQGRAEHGSQGPSHPCQDLGMLGQPQHWSPRWGQGQAVVTARGWACLSVATTGLTWGPRPGAEVRARWEISEACSAPGISN